MMPNMVQAGQYSSTVHYLPAVEAAGTDGAAAVMARMRNTPINDFFVKIRRIREDGRMIHDMYLFEVKKPSKFEGCMGLLPPRDHDPGRSSFHAACAVEMPTAPRSPLTVGLFHPLGRGSLSF